MASTAPYHDRDGFIWYDGKLVPWREANLHVLSHGLHYASAVFEGERAYNGVIFKRTEHSERLKKSAIAELITTNSVPVRSGDGFPITSLCIAELLGEGIKRIHDDESVSSLFRISETENV